MVLILSANRTLAFPLFAVTLRHSTAQSSSASSSSAPGGFDISSNLISQLAVVALKLRLADHRHVACDVQAKSADLLKGRVGPVTVKGRGWESGLGLTCRAIEATVDECALDIERVIKNQKLVLTTAALGRAMIALDAADFGNFITHPLLRPPSSGIAFLKDDVRIDARRAAVYFYADVDGEQWMCRLCKAEDSDLAIIESRPATKPVDDSWKAQANQMGAELSLFFNQMIFELDGTFLSFRDMMVTDKGTAPSVLLSLDIKVQKFPSPGLAF